RHSPEPLDHAFFFSSRSRHTRWPRDWSSDVCSSDLSAARVSAPILHLGALTRAADRQGALLEVDGDRLLRYAGEVERIHEFAHEIGRASCRERVRTAGGAGTLQKKG